MNSGCLTMTFEYNWLHGLLHKQPKNEVGKGRA